MTGEDIVGILLSAAALVIFILLALQPRVPKRWRGKGWW